MKWLLIIGFINWDGYAALSGNPQQLTNVKVIAAYDTQAECEVAKEQLGIKLTACIQGQPVTIEKP